MFIIQMGKLFLSVTIQKNKKQTKKLNWLNIIFSWCSWDYKEPIHAIALFTVTFAYLHYNVFERGCEAISGNFAVSARNCLTFTFKYIVMQMRKVNCENGYYLH